MTNQSHDGKTLKSLIERRHPEYDNLKDHWTFLDMSYNGGRPWFKKNIFRYFKEGDREYKDRIERAYRFNHTREVVDLTNKYLFRAKASRKEDANQKLLDFWENANGHGLDIDDFMKSVSKASSIFGRPWLIVDSTKVEKSENESKEDDDFSVYAYIVKPENVLDYSWNDEDGRLNWILVREEIRDDEDPFDSENVNVRYRYRLWTRNQWFLYIVPSDSTEPYEENYGDHELGLVPAIPCDNMLTDELWYSPALIGDIAYLDRAVANYLSNLDAIIQDQTFSQLAIPGQSMLPGEEGHDQMIEMGTKRVFVYDGEGGGAPTYLSPDPRQAELIISAIQQIINEIYHSVGLAGERTKQDNSKGIDNSSGVAKSKDFERVNSLLLAKANALEFVENELVRVVSAYAGETVPKDEVVNYPEDFDVRGLQDEFDVAVRLSAIQAPEYFKGKQLEVIASKLFPTSSDKQKKEVQASVQDYVTRLKELSDFELENQKNSLTGETEEEKAKRDRSRSGKLQSDTKKRQEIGER